MYNALSTQQSELRRLATRLYREHRTYLFAIARRNATCRADAEEALQEAFIAFIRHFDPERGAPPLAWLIFYADLRVMPTSVGKPACQAEIALRRSA